MDQPENPEFIARTTRTSQILIGAMVLGLTIFAVIVTFVIPQPVAGPRQGQAQAGTSLFTYAALVVGALGLVASVLIPRTVAAIERRKIARGTWSPPRDAGSTAGPADDAAKLVSVYQVQLIIGAALNEFAAFFALIASMIEHNPITLGLGILLTLCVAARFPTAARVEQWVEAQLQQMTQERQFGG
jgi:hypothetical protein